LANSWGAALVLDSVPLLPIRPSRLSLKSTTIPVLLIHGEDEINILPRLWLKLIPHMPSCGLCLEPGTVERYRLRLEEFWDRVLGFLAHNDSVSKFQRQSVNGSAMRADYSSLRSSE
jgi:hypothetical protein